MKTGRQREALGSRVVHALVGVRAGVVRNAFCNWKPMEGREEWRDVVSVLLLEDKKCSLSSIGLSYTPTAQNSFCSQGCCLWLD